VLLEGFAPDETPGMFSSRLRGRHVDVINCSRGNLEMAIKELGSSLFSADRTTVSAG
jgi:hypothetical protein